MSLVNILASSMDNYNDGDKAWGQFIKDHKDYLIANSNTATISPSFMQQYQYNLNRYLLSINYKISCAWIILLINNMVNDIAFTMTIGSLLIPPFSTIELLYTTYISTKQTGT